MIYIGIQIEMILSGGTELHTGKRQFTTFHISGKRTDFTVYRYIDYLRDELDLLDIFVR